MTCQPITKSSTSVQGLHTVHEARGALTVDLDDAPTIEMKAVHSGSSIEGTFAEVLGEVMGVERVPVDSNFFDDLGADSMVMARFCARVRKRPELPAVSMKDIYQHRTIKRLATAFGGDAPLPLEGTFAEVLVEVMGVERVPVDSNFFDDLGADSMVMARFCARVRKRPELPAVSMKDIYQNPTIKGLATALCGDPPVAGNPPIPVELPAPSPVEVVAPTSVKAPKPARTPQVLLCGVLQILIFLGYGYLAALLVVQGFEWISASSGLLDIYLRSLLSGWAMFLFVFTVPILAKWILIGRWKPRQIRIWTLAYLRFWLVKTLIQWNPIVLFTGSPLFSFYLRTLGAKVGRGVVIFSTHVPVCTDLLSIGDGTVIQKDSFINGYRAHAGVIQVGAITIGKNAVISESTVIDIDTSMGDGTQLGRASSLHAGQAVPDGERWHGSPAQPTDANYQSVEPTKCGALRRVGYTLIQLLSVLVVYLPLGISGLIVLLQWVPQLRVLLEPGTQGITNGAFYIHALIVSSLFYFGGLIFALLYVLTIPRILNLGITPDKVYPLYGFFFALHRAIARRTNVKALTSLFGDSSYILSYLRRLGYRFWRPIQTGSNFGQMVKHDNPYLSSIGRGTMVADGLSIINAEFSSTSFRVSRVAIGPHNFLGNSIAYPAQGKTGANCLLATKVLVPIDGEVRENVGLLGSPSFEIPRTVERDGSFDHLIAGDGLRKRLAAKNRHNIVTMGLYLFIRWLFFFALILVAGAVADLYASLGASVIVMANVVILLFGIVYWILVDRLITLFLPVRPLFCSIYDRAFWRHERFWKVPAGPGVIQVFNGTPFKTAFWRLLGVRIGRRVFDDGLWVTERTLVVIGDDCTFNAGSGIQCHSQEDGAFKSDVTTIGAGCTFGVGAFVHYGVTIGDGAVLAPDSFVMKGEEVPPHEYWGGNPASEMPVPGTQGIKPTRKLRVRPALITPAAEMPAFAALANPAAEMTLPAALVNPAAERPVPAALGVNPTRKIPVPAALRGNSFRKMPAAAALALNPAGKVAAPVARSQDRAGEVPVPAVLDLTGGWELLVPAALGLNPTRRMPIPAAWGESPPAEISVRAALGVDPAREMPVPVALGVNPVREMPVPAALGLNPTRRMPVPAAWGERPAAKMSVPAALGTNPAWEMPVPALGPDPAWEKPVPAAAGLNPARERPIPAAVGLNPARERPIPAALGLNPTRRMPVPAAHRVRPRPRREPQPRQGQTK
jgi:non-ribosomal peptide synthetase-like protein